MRLKPRDYKLMFIPFIALISLLLLGVVFRMLTK
jgi:hypothetical protein